jgi:putative prophage lp2 protein 26
MNRTIKFRGKSIYDEEWLYGSLVRIEKDIYAVIPSLNDIEIGKSIGMYEVCLETIGQFTGLYDRNGKEVCEHDYISIIYKYEDIGVNGGVIPDQDCICEGGVVYMNEFSCFGIRLHKAEYPIKESLDECIYSTIPLLHFDLEGDSIEVLGNIYDNPELIKEE